MKARVSLHRDFVVGDIDPRLYGAFVEHVGRCVYEGIFEPGHPTADADGFRGDVLELVRGLDIPVVRYPGGNFLSAYNWEDGIGPREQRPVRLHLNRQGRDTNQVGVDDFARWCERAGTEMSLAVNLGTRGIDAAMGLLEYCNYPRGSARSDLRRRHGREEPYGVKLWYLGNELDGPWQTGHKTAYEYGRLANETARAMRMFDPTLQLVAAGSSNSEMPTWPQWDADMLDECYDAVDYLSLHMYFDDFEHDPADLLAKGVVLDRFLRTAGAVIDYVKAKKRSRRDVFIAFDEWNVRYHGPRPRRDAIPSGSEWPMAEPVLEQDYTMVDVLVVGGILNSFIRAADRVKIACIAQLVNVIAPIRTEAGGRAWRQTIYHPLRLASLHGRGRALDMAVDVPLFSAPSAEDVPYLDLAAVENDGERMLTLFVINRHPTDEMELDVTLTGWPAARLAQHIVIHHPDPMATNTADAPDHVVPRPGSGVAVGEGAVRGRLPPFSYHMIRIAV